MINLFNYYKNISFSFKRLNVFSILFLIVLTFTASAKAQTSLVAQTGDDAKTKAAETRRENQPRAEGETDARVKQLESQVQAMQAQIEELKKLVVQSQNTNQAAVAAPAEKTANSDNVAKTEEKKTETAKAEVKQPAQQKQIGVDIGSARLTPYGTIYFNAFSNSGGTNNADVPLFATPTGSGNTSASVRQTRLGVRLDGARVGNANLKAVLEADFFGGFPNIGIGENFGVVRLRLANARLEWEKTSLTVGQDWMVFAPVNPTSLAATAIPQLAASGNPWARLPQIKVERKLGKNFLFQGAILAPQTGDYPTASNFFLQPTSGAASRVPFFQSRIAFSDANFFGTKKAGTIGLSGHFGQSRVTVGSAARNIDSNGLALDWNVPLHARVVLAGEAFFGRNLAGFQAGIFQSYNADFAYRNGTTLTPGGVRGIGTTGGWTQLGWTLPAFKDRLAAYASIGIDDPRDGDLVTVSRVNFRSRNLVYAFDLIYKFSPQFSFGAEFRHLKTRYLFTDEKDSNHINLAAAYSF